MVFKVNKGASNTSPLILFLHMPTTLIASNPDFKKTPPSDGRFLQVAELFGNTVQGENISGSPSTFLRLQGCTLECIWCDTLEVWRYGNPYSFDEIFELLENSDIIKRLESGQHLILTGGSPLKQQRQLVDFLTEFVNKYSFLPIIEIENECTIMPIPELEPFIDVWNNSPKLSNSGMKEKARYKPEILKHLGSFDNSFFKFVISSEEDWNEIKTKFLDTDLIHHEQIVIMPEGQTREELQAHYEIVVEIAVRESVRMCDRMHVTIWNKKTGV